MNEKNGAVNFTEKYRREAQSAKAVIVDVIAPSGFIFKFEKPSKFAMMFKLAALPQFASSAAVEKWTEEGIVKGLTDGDEDTLTMAKTVIDVRDRVLELSHLPKLVIGKAKKNNELSTDDVKDEDLSYLFRWVQAGGDTSLMLRTFPERSQPDTLASAGRKARRHKAKSNGGA